MPIIDYTEEGVTDSAQNEISNDQIHIQKQQVSRINSTKELLRINSNHVDVEMLCMTHDEELRLMKQQLKRYDDKLSKVMFEWRDYKRYNKSGYGAGNKILSPPSSAPKIHNISKCLSVTMTI